MIQFKYFISNPWTMATEKKSRRLLWISFFKLFLNIYVFDAFSIWQVLPSHTIVTAAAQWAAVVIMSRPLCICVCVLSLQSLSKRSSLFCLIHFGSSSGAAQGWKPTFDGRRLMMEDNLRWKMTFDGRRLMMEDDL